MCTLSIITRENGYLLGMNRDERIARGAGLPPEFHESCGFQAIYPSDGEGGTWIGGNEHGAAFAVLNWSDVIPQEVQPVKTHSRGGLVPALIRSRTLQESQQTLATLNCEGMLPFRLVGIFPAESRIGEWRWDLSKLDFTLHGWQARHWFSSSLSDLQAEGMRGNACRDAWKQSDAASSAWLRRLHASHGDAPGPFSLCVHRTEVKTLSYTEIECTPEKLRMEHFLGSPCETVAEGAIGHGTNYSLDLERSVS